MTIRFEKRKRIGGIAALALAAIVVPWPMAWARDWVGPTGDWHTDSNWSPSGVPAAGEDVTVSVANAVISLTNETATLGSFTMTGGQLVFSNWYTRLIATNVALNGGTNTLPAAFTNGGMSNRVWIVCSNNFTLGAGAIINARGKGYYRDNGQGKDPGLGDAGGGYGGQGGCGGGLPYGSTNTPLAPGSGGGNHSGVGEGGDGGGAVRIEARGTITINGTIDARGSDATHNGGGSSGGAIYITCHTFGGSTNGLLSVAGGSACWWGTYYLGWGGGGGRIAVDYTSLDTTHGVRFAASPGLGYSATIGAGCRIAAGDGTLWLPNQALLSETLADYLFTGVHLFIPGFTSWAVNSLTVSNCSLTFPDTGFALAVTNNLQIIGTNGRIGVYGNVALSQGNLILTNGGALYIYAGTTNGTPGDYGAQVAVAGDVTIGALSWIYPTANESNGACVRFAMRNLTVATNAGFNADGRGYSLGRGSGGGGNNTGRGGGGYGGQGGYYSTQPGGGIYGFTNAPLAPGSAGGYNTALWMQSGGGGGLVWIEASGDVTLNGTLSANGLVAGGSSAGGGAGGGILVSCRKFSGNSTASLKADGGGAAPGWAPNWYGGGGGGGRIAVWQAITPTMRNALINGRQLTSAHASITNTPFAGYAGTLSVTNGIGWDTYNATPDKQAQPGSAVFLDVVLSKGTFVGIH